MKEELAEAIMGVSKVSVPKFQAAETGKNQSARNLFRAENDGDDIPQGTFHKVRSKAQQCHKLFESQLVIYFRSAECENFKARK